MDLNEDKKIEVLEIEEPKTEIERAMSKEIEKIEKHLDSKGNKKEKKKKERGFTYVSTQEKKNEIDEIMIGLKETFENEPGNYLEKNEIIALSPYRIYIEERILEEKHVVFLFFFNRYNGHIKKACDKVGISRELFYKWKNKNEVFSKIVAEFNQGFLDDTEQCLQNLIENGSAVATIFKLKTQAQDRGYVEKQIIENIEGPKLIRFSFIDVNNDKNIIDAELEDE